MWRQKWTRRQKRSWKESRRRTRPRRRREPRRPRRTRRSSARAAGAFSGAGAELWASWWGSAQRRGWGWWTLWARPTARSFASGTGLEAAFRWVQRRVSPGSAAPSRRYFAASRRGLPGAQRGRRRGPRRRWRLRWTCLSGDLDRGRQARWMPGLRAARRARGARRWGARRPGRPRARRSIEPAQLACERGQHATPRVPCRPRDARRREEAG